MYVFHLLHISRSWNMIKRIMFHFTISRFRGDTAYSLVSRIIATFLGGLVGTAMWCVLFISALESPSWSFPPFQVYFIWVRGRKSIWISGSMRCLLSDFLLHQALLPNNAAYHHCLCFDSQFGKDIQAMFHFYLICCGAGRRLFLSGRFHSCPRCSRFRYYCCLGALPLDRT